MYPIDYEWTGLKLMEHSYVGNTYVNAIIGHLMTLEKGCRMIHIGDYSRDLIKDKIKGFIEFEDYNMDPKYLFDMCWTAGISDRFQMPRISDKEIVEFEWMKKAWVVNVDKHEYIECVAESPKDKDGNFTWEIAQLPLLIAVGNGEGGGDYHGPDMDLVGSWAGDRLKVFTEEPYDYFKLENTFKE